MDKLSIRNKCLHDSACACGRDRDCHAASSACSFRQDFFDMPSCPWRFVLTHDLANAATSGFFPKKKF
jgi:hypothetical protein